LGDGLSFPYEKIDTYDLLVGDKQHASIAVKDAQCVVTLHVLHNTGGEESVLALAVLGMSGFRHTQDGLSAPPIQRISVKTVVDQVLGQPGRKASEDA
jgi:hypothetical protein